MLERLKFNFLPYGEGGGGCAQHVKVKAGLALLHRRREGLALRPGAGLSPDP